MFALNLGGLFGQIGLSLLQVALPGLGTVISGMVIALLSKNLKKAGLQLTAEQQTQLQGLVERAIRAAEEAARRNPNLSGDDKSVIAQTIIRTQMPQLPPAAVREAIDSTLPKLRALGHIDHVGQAQALGV
jgi:hypothetical protein